MTSINNYRCGNDSEWLKLRWSCTTTCDPTFYPLCNQHVKVTTWREQRSGSTNWSGPHSLLSKLIRAYLLVQWGPLHAEPDTKEFWGNGGRDITLGLNLNKNSLNPWSLILQGKNLSGSWRLPLEENYFSEKLLLCYSHVHMATGKSLRFKYRHAQVPHISADYPLETEGL